MKRDDLCSAPGPVVSPRSRPGHRCDGPWASDQHVLLVAIAEAAHVHLGSLSGGRRYGSIVKTRFVAAWMLRSCLGLSYPAIGRALGGRDHTTAMNACLRVQCALGDARDGLSAPLVDHLLDIIGRLAEAA